MKRILPCSLILIILPALVYAAVTDYLILQDIGSYKLFTTAFPEDFNGGPLPKYSQTNTAGVLQAAHHFSDNDVSYEAAYSEANSRWSSITVEVTQHAGADSDRWLLHEVEDSYRDGDDSDGRLGLLSGAGVKIREIGGKRFIYWGLGGGSYTWISNQKVIEIKYTDLQRIKPEPLEVVQAYLQKFPSTIALTDAEIKSRAHNETWIKDEMERRLWLCDKWNAQFQLGKVTQADMLKQLADHMTVFLKYRHRYYGITATDDIIALDDYLRNNDATAIMNKLTAYKAWWAANKENAINL